jgi:succinoglycan biosynthesis transport protein ExoP
LLEVLSDNAMLSESVWTDPVTGLVFLPGAVKSRIAHSHEILASDQTKAFFDRLSGDFDYVIVDFPPLAPVVDVRTTAHFVDAYVFVVEWGRTQVPVVERALHTARGVGDNLLGVVLNKADIAQMGRYGSYGGNSYYHNAHYGRYGYTD